MKARHLRDLGSSCQAGDEVVFEDADGNIHEIYSAMRVRYRGGEPKLILRETVAKDFFLEIKQPPQELIDRLEMYNEEHDLI